MNSNPLVSFCLRNYNQREFIGDALDGALSQTYSPMEIVISDDASTDGSIELIQSKINSYKESGGKHTVIFLKNEQNIGLVLNCQKVYHATHGELIVNADGDDISKPNRVERLVELWVDSNGKYDAIYSGAEKIDCDGKYVGELPERYFSRCFLGAVAAYSRRLIFAFPPITVKVAGDDTIFAKRTEMLGGSRLFIKENLVRYRVGSGISTARQNWRLPNLRSHQLNIGTAEQLFLDLEYMGSRLTNNEIEVWRQYCNRLNLESHYHIALLSGANFRERLNAYKKVHYHPWFRPGGWFQLLCLLPKKLGDPLLNFLLRVSNLMNR